MNSPLIETERRKLEGVANFATNVISITFAMNVTSTTFAMNVTPVTFATDVTSITFSRIHPHFSHYWEINSIYNSDLPLVVCLFVIKFRAVVRLLTSDR